MRERLTKNTFVFRAKEIHGDKYDYSKTEFQILINEVTQKLEELEKKYYSEETSQKEKDEYALEAGKLITEELLHNTKDNAGLL